MSAKSKRSDRSRPQAGDRPLLTLTRPAGELVLIERRTEHDGREHWLQVFVLSESREEPMGFVRGLRVELHELRALGRFLGGGR